MEKTVKAVTWLLVTSLIASFMLIPAQPASATPVYRYEWVSQSGTVSPDGYAHQYTGLVAGQTINLSLTLINRSGTTIVGKSSLPITPGYQVPIGSWGVGTQNPQDGTPYFLDSSSFILNNNRFVYYDNENLGDWPNGASRTMGWTVKLTNNLVNGVYSLYVRPVSEYNAWTQQYKNGKTLPSYNSDIFWQFVVGGGTVSHIYTNSAHGLQLTLPDGYLAKSNDYGVMDAALAQAFYITSQIVDTGVTPIIDIYTYNVPAVGQSFYDFVQSIYNLNYSKGQTTTDITQANYDGALAYEFGLQNGYHSSTGGGLLRLPGARVTLLQWNGKTYTFLQTGESPVLRNILSSIRWISM